MLCKSPTTLAKISFGKSCHHTRSLQNLVYPINIATGLKPIINSLLWLNIYNDIPHKSSILMSNYAIEKMYSSDH